MRQSDVADTAAVNCFWFTWQECARSVDGISQLRKVQLSVAMQKARLEVQERLEMSKMTASQLESWIGSDCLL